MKPTIRKTSVKVRRFCGAKPGAAALMSTVRAQAPAGAVGCTFCHEQQKVPKNALDVTVAALALRAADAGPRRSRGAWGRASRAGGFIPPSEYSLKGSPTQTSGAFAVGNQSRFARMTQVPVACTGAKNALRLMRQRRTPGTHRRIDSTVSRTCAGKLHPERAKPDRGVSEYGER